MECKEDVYIDEEHNPLMHILKLQAKRIAIAGKPTTAQENASHEIDKMMSDLIRKQKQKEDK